MKRRASSKFLAFLLAATVGFGSLVGCRTIMGLLSGDLDVEDIDKDIKGIKALGKALSKANQAITEEDEYYLGRAVAVSVLNQYSYRYLEYSSFQQGQVGPGLTNYLFHIGKLLVTAAQRKPLKGDRRTPLAGYHFIVLNSPEINAFAAPGGYIFLTTGILRLARNEDEVAAILAHEMSHVIRGHGVNAIKKARWNSVGKIFFSEAASGVFGDQAAATDFLNAAVGDILNRMVQEGYSQKAEFEADASAMRLLAVTGYNPWALYNMIKAMDQQGAGHAKGMYKTHPTPMSRLKALYKITPKYKYPKPPEARYTRFRAAIGHLPPTT
ncbi:MAG: M48 family metalloprotease [bacterium]